MAVRGMVARFLGLCCQFLIGEDVAIYVSGVGMC